VTPLAKLFIVTAVSFAVVGDYYLKRYGDGRKGWDLFLCLTLWEVCALMWVVAYRQHVPLGRSTTFGAAMAVTANVLIGLLVFGEEMRVAQWCGVACVIAGILLVG
jgi:multidrug transporter EmrE-like cation transporter